MATRSPPVIFSPQRRRAVRARARALQAAEQAREQARGQAPHPLLAEIAADILERLAFLRVKPMHALVIGDVSGVLAAPLRGQGARVVTADPAPGPGVIALDEERPWAEALGASGLLGASFDTILSLNTLASVNDLPGALLHAHRALVPGGVLIAVLAAVGSLPALRAAMLSADGPRPAARFHPAIDAQSGAGLLQRAGFADPVADTRGFDLGYRTLAGLLADVRASGGGAMLANHAPSPGKAGLARARAAFAALADGARTIEHIEIVTLTGWRR